jgi:uncharacterized protein
MKHRTITKPEEIRDIIDKCIVCHVAMVDEKGHPYVLPFNFGMKDNVLHLHSAQQGKKIDILRNNPRVCVAFSTDYHLRYQNEEVACSWSMKYRSVLIYGQVEFIEDYDEKIAVMNEIMKKYAGREFGYNMPAIKEVAAYRIIPEEITARAYGY